MTESIVCSFDVGITHLAYCILKKGEETYDILEWNIINSMNDDVMRNLVCKCKTKKGGICGKKAKYYVYTAHEYMNYPKDYLFGFCALHVAEGDCIEEFNMECLKLLSKDGYGKCKYEMKNKNICNKSAKYRIGNIHYCKSHHESVSKKYMEKYSITEYRKNKISKMSIKDIQLNLIRIFDNNPQFLQVTEVIIENQPALKNPTMKSIASVISNYFLIRGIVDKEKTNSKIKHVQFICPCNKLKINNDNTVAVLSRSGKEKYKRTKQLGIQYCKQLINKKWLTYLETFKKKDDLCDAYLQGVYYIDYYKKKNRITV